MLSWQGRVFDKLIRALALRRNWGPTDVLAARARRVYGSPRVYGRLHTLGLSLERVRQVPVQGEWLSPPGAKAGTVMYVHGGGFVSCAAATHRPIAAALARCTKRRVFSVDYRLAPESPLPAALDDISAAFQWLVDGGTPARQIALVGDSAGGNLVVGLALRLRDAGKEPPACVVAFSPWTDLAGRSESVRSNDGHCAMFRTENISDFAVAALGGLAADDPIASPVYARLGGLPPVLLHVGSLELLLDDSRRLHNRIVEAGGRSELRVFDGVPHCWQMLTAFVPEAGVSLRTAASFIDEQLAVPVTVGGATVAAAAG